VREATQSFGYACIVLLVVVRIAVLIVRSYQIRTSLQFNVLSFQPDASKIFKRNLIIDIAPNTTYK